MENTVGDSCRDQHMPNVASYDETPCKHQKNSRYTGNEPPRTSVQGDVGGSNAAQAASVDFFLEFIPANQQQNNKFALCKPAEKRMHEAVKIACAECAFKTLFLRDVSHELRTQLNTIIGFSDIIQSELLGPIANSKYTDYARDINHGGAQLLRFMSDMVDILRMEAGHFGIAEEELDLAACLVSSMHIVEQQAQTGQVHLLRDIAGGLPLMRGDRTRIRQIFTSLMRNAIKFTPAEGNVRVSAAKAVCGGIKVDIFCSGTGLEPGDPQKMFAPIGRLANGSTITYDGAGIDLLMAGLLTRWHDGVLSIDGRSGEGAGVTVTFPASRIVDEESKIR